MINITIFKYLAIFEGLSYLILLGICMPLKYMYDMPEPTVHVGRAHGFLFIAYCIWLLIVGLQLKWDFKTLVIGFVASLLPFGTFIFEKRYLPKKAI